MNKQLETFEQTSLSKFDLTRHRRKLDLLVIVLIAVFIGLGCFGRTLFKGIEISKLPVLAAEDYFFNNQIRFAIPRPRFDPSLFQFHIPFQIYADKQMKAGHIPLWNPSFGCGFPTIGETQYCLFSPFRGIFKASDPYLYNLGIVVKAVTAAVSTFVLARLISLSMGASIFASLAYGLCPFVLRELELPNEVQLIPAMAAAFVYLSNRSTFFARATLAAVTALGMASMHPEFFFLSVVYGLVLTLAVRPIQKSNEGETPNTVQPAPWQSWFTNVAIAGIFGILLSSFLLLPFFELLANGDSYKFHSKVIQSVPLQTLLAGLTTPLYGGGSPFAGTVSLAMALFALGVGGRKTWSLGALLVAIILMTAIPGPLAEIAAIKPFSYIPPRYLLGHLLSCLTILSAVGFDLIIDVVKQKRWKKIFVLTQICAILAFVSFWLISNASNQTHLTLPGFDGTLPSSQAMASTVRIGSIALIATFIATTFSATIPKLPWLKIIPVLLIVANVASMMNVTRQALPATGPFSFRTTGVLDEIKKNGERMTAAGNYFFSPNIAMAYGLRDFRETGALMPKRSNNFVRNAGGKKISRTMSESFYITPLLDSASVKYLITRWPVYSSADKPLPQSPLPGLVSAPQIVNSSVSIKSGSYCLSKRGEIFVHLVWHPTADDATYYAAELALVDSQGNVIAQGQRKQIGHGNINGKEQDQYLSIKTPVEGNNSAEMTLAMRMYSVLTESVVPPVKSQLPFVFDGIELLKISPQLIKDATDLSSARLKFLSEDSDHILLYQNQNALPQAYLTTNFEIVPDYEKACEILSGEKFDIATTTVIETGGNKTPGKGITLSNKPVEKAVVERPDPNTVIVKAEAAENCFLVLTDTFYPGWKAILDGKETPIFAANTNFRAIEISKGSHRIVFKYEPESYSIGKTISLTCLAGLLFVLIWRVGRKKKVVQIDT